MNINRRFQQLGSMAFMVGNTLFFANKLNEMSRLFFSRSMADVISGQNLFLILLGQITLIIGFVAYYQLYSPRTEKFARLALRLLCGGGILLAVGHVSFMAALPSAEPMFLLVLVGVLLLLIGLLWFGILNLRQAMQTQYPWLPLASGLMGFIGFVFFGGEEITALFLFFRTLFALGLVGIGFAMWLERPV